MTIRRIVPDIPSQEMEESREFYQEFLGLKLVMDLGFVITFVSPENPTAQLSVVREDTDSAVLPDISIEVSDVDQLHGQAQARGVKIVYPLTDEPWGVRRFFVEDPNGKILNILSHLVRS